MRDRCSGAASGNTKRSEKRPASGSVWRRRAMPWFSSRPPGRSAPARRRHRVDVRAAHVLHHADAGDGVEALAARAVAVVGDAEVDPVRDPGRGGALACKRGLRLRQRDAGDVDAVLARGVDREAAPAASDVEHPLPGLERQLAADQLELRLLRLLERRRATREDRAANRSSTRRGTARRTRSTRRSGGARRAGRAS